MFLYLVAIACLSASRQNLRNSLISAHNQVETDMWELESQDPDFGNYARNPQYQALSDMSYELAEILA